LGRLASEVAVALRGKDKPNFRPYLFVGDKVVVKNAGKIIITGKKLENKVYQRHTGYLGHLKTNSLKEIFAKNPGEVLKRAVYGMLPKNKLRNTWMKNLKIEN
jgi:large subunit ribosomal protein L13